VRADITECAELFKKAAMQAGNTLAMYDYCGGIDKYVELKLAVKK